MTGELSVKKNKTAYEKIVVNDADRYIKYNQLDFSELTPQQRKYYLGLHPTK